MFPLGAMPGADSRGDGKSPQTGRFQRDLAAGGRSTFLLGFDVPRRVAIFPRHGAPVRASAGAPPAVERLLSRSPRHARRERMAIFHPTTLRSNSSAIAVAMSTPTVMKSTDLVETLLGIGRPRALVLGDLMLDRYTQGNVERISPEAPVIVLQADRRERPAGRGGQRRQHAASLGGRGHLLRRGGAKTPPVASCAIC